jgi:Zn finger protein HypA/HybF involved in hydrogenase expression
VKHDDREVRVTRRFYRCPKCDGTRLEPIGVSHPVHPPLFQHRCLDCQEVVTLSELQGSIHYED